MIFTGGTKLLRTLFLSARDAARRFVPPHVKVTGLNSAWRPMVLRWRRRGKNLPNVIVHRAAAGGTFLSWPQFHFHFANYQTHGSSTNVSRDASSSTRVFDTRILRDELRASLRPVNSSQEGFSYRPLAATNTAPQSTAGARHFGNAFLSTSKSRAASLVAPQVSAPRKYLSSRPAVISVRPFRPTDSFEAPGRQVRIVHYWSPLPLARSRNQSDGASQHTPERKVLPPQYRRTEELVWRRVSKSTTEITERVRHLESIVSSDGPPSRAASNEQTAVEVERAIEAVRAMPVTKLDPALMDRLANDVIRRVEQRVRIERERRGL
jgi:hypothetical protein